MSCFKEQTLDQRHESPISIFAPFLFSTLYPNRPCLFSPNDHNTLLPDCLLLTINAFEGAWFLGNSRIYCI
jgi:hypothetical protein